MALRHSVHQADGASLRGVWPGARSRTHAGAVDFRAPRRREFSFARGGMDVPPAFGWRRCAFLRRGPEARAGMGRRVRKNEGPAGRTRERVDAGPRKKSAVKPELLLVGLLAPPARSLRSGR